MIRPFIYTASDGSEWKIDQWDSSEPWQWWHVDYDGAEDSHDHRHGEAASKLDCEKAIEALVDENRGGPWVTCAKCGDRIRSVSVHDFVACKCKETFVDGGKEYTRTGGFPIFDDDPDMSEEHSSPLNPNP